MHKKLGPLEAWQWAAIVAALLGAYLLYEHEKNAAAAASTTTSTGADTGAGAIDPTTGLPYADEIGTGAGGGYSGGGGYTGDTGTSTGASTDSGTTLDQELSDLGSIEGLMQNLGMGTTVSSSPAGLTPGQQNTLNKDLTNLQKTLGKQETALQKLTKRLTPKPKKPAAKKPPKKTVKHGGTKNPGHTVTTHANGKKTASSSAPHNGQQHKNIAPPAHQRATHPKKKKAARR